VPKGIQGVKTTVLLDGDVVAYKFASGGQTKIDWGDGAVSYDLAPEQDVFADCQRYILEIEEMLGADETIVCLSCPTPEKWRVKLWPQYTSRRTEKPQMLGAVKAFMSSRFPTYERPTLEADDIMGILSTHQRIIPGKKIIVSIDKDMKTIPGWLFNPDKDDFAREIGPDEADYWWMYQTLMGDSVDCYPGCPGIGPKKAEKILRAALDHDQHSMWDAVVDTYTARGYTEADALLQARLARILRHTDYDFKTKEVKLWKP
jgi:5'-3' exonuclease